MLSNLGSTDIIQIATSSFIVPYCLGAAKTEATRIRMDLTSIYALSNNMLTLTAPFPGVIGSVVGCGER